MTTAGLSAHVLADVLKPDLDLQGRLEKRLRSIAREIGRDIFPFEDVLRSHNVTDAEWQMLAQNRSFLQMIREERELWNSSLTTRERVDLKTLVMVEEALPAMYELMHAKNEPAAARVAAFTALQKGAGIGVQGVGATDTGGRVSITINMGDDRQLKLTQELPPVTLEGNVLESTNG